MADDMMKAESIITPRPDPTILTTEQLMREINQIRGQIGEKLATVKERFDVIEKQREEQKADAKAAIDVAHASTEKAILEAVTLADAKIATLAERLVGLKRETEANQAAAAAHLEAEVVWTGERFKSVQIAQDAATHAEDSARVGDRELFKAQIDSLREMLNERYQTQTKALDAAFVAQQAAVATSFDASEKAMAAALLAAKEAVEKANVATEKRFDNVTNLLSQQNSTLSVLLPRNEAEARLKALDDRMADLKSTVDKGFMEATTRDSTGQFFRTDNRASIGVYIAMAGLVLTLIIVIVAAMNLVTSR